MNVIDDPSRFVKLMNMLAASYPNDVAHQGQYQGLC